VSGERVPIIQVRDFSAGYDGEVVLSGVNFEVHTGEVFAILGGSGSGKSTLLKHMIGLYKPLAGSILIGGDDITTAEGERRLRILRKFGVMFQSGALFGSMTLLENIALPLEEFTDLPPEAIRLIAHMKLQRVGLGSAADQMPSELSGGMQKRGAIARAMALDPQLLFLDELSAGLDPVTSAELDELVLSLARSLKITFVVVTHELPSIFTIAERVIMLDKDKKGIIAQGNPRELRDHCDDPVVRQFFSRGATGADGGLRAAEQGSER
jgi:phospholipid/cholesterol/gamma-HCH transport system ATP-binding protein